MLNSKMICICRKICENNTCEHAKPHDCKGVAHYCESMGARVVCMEYTSSGKKARSESKIDLTQDEYMELIKGSVWTSFMQNKKRTEKASLRR